MRREPNPSHIVTCARLEGPAGVVFHRDDLVAAWFWRARLSLERSGMIAPLSLSESECIRRRLRACDERADEIAARAAADKKAAKVATADLGKTEERLAELRKLLSEFTDLGLKAERLRAELAAIEERLSTDYPREQAEIERARALAQEQMAALSSDDGPAAA